MSKDHQEDYLSKDIEKKETALTTYNETKKALETEERFVDFFKNYDPQSVKSFINYYAQLKTGWLQHGASFSRMREYKSSRWRRGAVAMLKEIMEKKLFNLKCRWVAGEMDLPGIDTSSDFGKWLHNPNLASEHLEPISPEEYRCYLDYAKWAGENNYDPDYDDDAMAGRVELEMYHSHRVKRLEEEKIKFIEWFNHYDARFGTAHLAALPLTRVELEEDYHDIWFVEIHLKQYSEEIQKKQLAFHLSPRQKRELRNDAAKREAYLEARRRSYEEQEKSMPKYEHISVYDRPKMEKLVAMIEPPEVQKLYYASRRWHDKQKRSNRVNDPTSSLMEAKEWIPIEANEDYYEGMIEAWNSYSGKKTMQALQSVYEEYRECLAEKKPFDWDVEDSRPYGNTQGERILAARKLKNEPENFDFLKKENLPK